MLWLLINMQTIIHFIAFMNIISANFGTVFLHIKQ